MLQPGELVCSRYEILNTVGKGGMSVVYRVKDLQTQTILALKDVKRTAQGDNQVVEQSLVAEGRMLMQLSDPHLPRIYDIIEEHDRIMLVMDFIQGESLDRVIAREGAQSVERVLDWGMQICQALHYLHTRPVPIIYRDMKPSNVMLQPDGTLTIIDFGTARTEKVGVAMQADTICIGTAGFAAPEQFGGIGQSTARTDIFCLGATLYNMVTGHSPCDRPIGILPLEQWNPALANTPISEIITKCTRNDPDARYQTAMQLYADLQLARTGAYKVSGKRSYGFHLTTNLRRQEWQKQEMQGKGMITSGLSELFQKPAGSAVFKPGESEPAAARTQTPAGFAETQWQTAAHPPLAEPEKPQENGNVIRMIVVCAAVAAAVFTVFSIIAALLSSVTVSAVLMIVAVGAVVVALAGLILSGKA